MLSGARSPSTGAAEAGFTLIELMVGMVLAGMLLAVAGRVIIDSLQSGATSGATHKAISAGTNAVSQAGEDLRAAISPGRTGADAPTKNLLRAGIWDGATMPLDVRDIVLADPNELWFRSDVVPQTSGEPVSECVGYVLTPTQGLLRHVDQDWRDCPSATPNQTTVLLPTPSSAMPRSVFSYTLRYNRPVSTAPTSAAACELRTSVDPAGSDDLADPHELYLISAVKMNLSAMVVRGDALGASHLRDTFALRSRSTHDYQYAVGCAF